MLAAFAETARLLDRDDYREVAEHNAAFLLNELRRDSGRLHRSWKDGESKLNGYLKDHSYLIEGLLELYQTTFDPRWFLAAQELAAPCSLTSRHLKACSWRRRANCQAMQPTLSAALPLSRYCWIEDW
jgi:uncharacterized protein YyaL (SSP411 family)